MTQKRRGFRLSTLPALAEVPARQIYWRLPGLVSRYQEVRGRYRTRTRTTSVGELEAALDAAGVGDAQVVLVHSALGGVHLDTGQGEPQSNPLAVSLRVLKMLDERVGDRTLAMPTHPHYDDAPDGFGNPDEPSLYDPAVNRSTVGMLGELFRRRPGVQRSLHPLSSMAVRGPLADEILEGNLNEHRPLPHGETSSYYRLSRRGGLVVSIGIPLIKSISVFHVAEELRADTWPVEGFFQERRFRVRAGGEEREWTVRFRRQLYVRSMAAQLVRRELLQEGIMRELTAGEIQVHIAQAGDVVGFMLERGGDTSYPYYLPRLAELGARGG